MTLIRLVISISCAAFGTVAHGQLLSERTDGLQRVCVYRDTVRTWTSGGETRQVRVGLADNCPLLPPQNDGTAPPPTAQLRNIATLGNDLLCTYEQAGREWIGRIAQTGTCPLSAGQLPANVFPRGPR